MILRNAPVILLAAWLGCTGGAPGDDETPDGAPSTGRGDGTAPADTRRAGSLDAVMSVDTLGPVDAVVPGEVAEDGARRAPGDVGGADETLVAPNDAAAGDGADGDPPAPGDALDDAPDASAAPSGTWAHPFVVGPLPWSHTGTTAMALSQQADHYAPCAPGTDESGPEVVYRLDLAEAATVRVAVDDHPGDAVDVDVHLMSSPDPLDCLARDNVAVTASLPAGSTWIALDTWVDGTGAVLAGPYVLSVTFASAGPAGCTTSPIQCTDADMPLVNGVLPEPEGLGGCPAGMARVDTFCVDRWEASLAVVLPGGALADWSPYAHPLQGTSVVARSVPGAVPQGYIDQVAAAAACAAAGKRLCTDAEWLRACRGPDAWTFPYGPTLQPGMCNDARECHPATQYFETTASWIWSSLGHPCLNQLPDGLAATGAYDGCESAEGVFDLMGNLHEWTADPAGTFRGGFYVDTAVNGPGCLYVTTAHNVSHWDYSTGFRCCADGGS